MEIAQIIYVHHNQGWCKSRPWKSPTPESPSLVWATEKWEKWGKWGETGGNGGKTGENGGEMGGNAGVWDARAHMIATQAFGRRCIQSEESFWRLVYHTQFVLAHGGGTTPLKQKET